MSNSSHGLLASRWQGAGWQQHAGRTGRKAGPITPWMCLACRA